MPTMRVQLKGTEVQVALATDTRVSTVPVLLLSTKVCAVIQLVRPFTVSAALVTSAQANMKAAVSATEVRAKTLLCLRLFYLSLLKSAKPLDRRNLYRCLQRRLARAPIRFRVTTRQLPLRTQSDEAACTSRVGALRILR